MGKKRRGPSKDKAKSEGETHRSPSEVVGGLAGGLAGIAAGEGHDLEWERAKQAVRDAWHRVPRQKPRPSE